MLSHLRERADDTRPVFIRARLTAHLHHQRTVCEVPEPHDPSDGYHADSFTRPRIVEARTHKELLEAYETYKGAALAKTDGAVMVSCEIERFSSEHHGNLHGGSETFRDEELPIDHVRPYISKEEWRAHPGQKARYDPVTRAVTWSDWK